MSGVEVASSGSRLCGAVTGAACEVISAIRLRFQGHSRYLWRTIAMKCGTSAVGAMAGRYHGSG